MQARIDGLLALPSGPAALVLGSVAGAKASAGGGVGLAATRMGSSAGGGGGGGGIEPVTFFWC